MEIDLNSNKTLSFKEEKNFTNNLNFQFYGAYRQKVPRNCLDDAPKSSIFQAYGWRQPEKHISAKDQIKDELNEMRGYLKSNMMKRVERLVENYVSRYLDFKL